MHTGNLSHSGDDGFQMLQVQDIEHYVNIGLTIGGAGFDVPDIRFRVTDDCGDLFQHAPFVIAEKGQLDGVSGGCAVFFIAGPLHVNPPLRLVEKVRDIGAVFGMYSNTLAASDVAHDVLASNWVTTSRTIDEQVAMPLDRDCIGIAAKTTAHHAGKPAALVLDFAGRLCTRWRQSPQYLACRVFTVANAGHQVVGPTQAVIGGNFLQRLVFYVFQRDAVLARFFLNQLAADFYGAFTLVNIEPVLDLVSSAGRFHHA